MVDDPLGGSRKRRDRLFIIAEILKVAAEGAFKTQVMYKASLSFSQLNEYLVLLLDLNLLEVVETPERTLYKTTKKGLQFLQRYKEIMELLREGSNIKEASSLYLVKHGTRVTLL